MQEELDGLPLLDALSHTRVVISLKAECDVKECWGKGGEGEGEAV